MSIYKAAISIHEPDWGTIYLFKEVGGQPQSFVHLLAAALEHRRKRNNPGRLAALICGAAGAERTGATTIYPDDRCMHFEHTWEYQIAFRKFGPISLRVFRHDPEDEKSHNVYDGILEGFISLELRRSKKPRGRTPAGYRNRDEYTAAYNERENDHLDADLARKERLAEEIYQERKRQGLPNLDLRGVKEYTLAEYKARRKLTAKKARDAVKKALDTD